MSIIKREDVKIVPPFEFITEDMIDLEFDVVEEALKGADEFRRLREEIEKRGTPLSTDERIDFLLSLEQE